MSLTSMVLTLEFLDKYSISETFDWKTLNRNVSVLYVLEPLSKIGRWKLTQYKAQFSYIMESFNGKLYLVYRTTLTICITPKKLSSDDLKF